MISYRSEGEPVPGAVVRGIESHAPGSATTDGKGRFLLTRLTRLPTTVGVWLDNRQAGFFPVEVGDGLPAITLQLPEAGHLRARFHRVSNEPLPATRVWFVPLSEEGEADGRRDVELLTDGNGRVKADLLPGTWVPRLLRSGGDKISGTPPRAVVRSGETTVVEVWVR